MSRLVPVMCLSLLLWSLPGRICAGDTPSHGIDRLIVAKRVQVKAQPAVPADDYEFVRRVYLDLIGRIPTRDEIQHFVSDRVLDKRSKLIDRLLACGEFSNHWRENFNALLMAGPAF